MLRARLVIADDHPLVLAGIRELIEQDVRFGVVGQAADPAALLEAVHAHQPDIVLTDYSMPAGQDTCDGFRLIARLRRVFPHIPVVVLTMITSPTMVEEMYRLGAFAVVTKASDPRELLSALSAARSGRGYRCSVSRRTSLVGLDAPPRRGLSPRELEVVRLSSNGERVSDIAYRLSRSRCTVSAQKRSAMRKLGARTDQELVVIGRSLAMLS